MEKYLYKSITSKLEFKQIENKDGQFVEIEGLASTFGNLDRDGDIIVKGAFTKTLQNPDIKVKFLHQHRVELVLGVLDHMIETDEGLFVKGRMPKENSIVKDLFPLLQMGAIGDFSIGFRIKEADTTPDGNRTITEIELFEVSIVTMPANPKARITSVKSDEQIVSVSEVENVTNKRELEQLLTNTCCFTRKAVITLASRFKYEKKSDSLSQKNSQSDSDKKNSQSDSDIHQNSLNEIDKIKQLFEV